MLRRPAASTALVVIVLLVLAAIFAPLISPYNPDTINVTHMLAGPSWNHLLGTDSLGRDNLSRDCTARGWRSRWRCPLC